MAGEGQHRELMNSEQRAALLRWILIGAGWLLIVVGGPVGGLLPGPLGFFFSFLGLGLILRNSLWARRKFVTLKRRYPDTLGRVSAALRRKPANGGPRHTARGERESNRSGQRPVEPKPPSARDVA